MNTLPLTIANSNIYLQCMIRIGFYGAIVIDFMTLNEEYTTRWRRCCNRSYRDLCYECIVPSHLGFFCGILLSSAFVHQKGKQRNGIFEDLKLDLGEGGEGNKSNPSAYDTAVSGTLK